jgi:hypothetical protein
MQRVPDPLTDTQGRSILLNCAELLGGIGELARHLNVSEQQVAEWLAGRSAPPPQIMVMAVESIVAKHRKPAR